MTGYLLLAFTFAAAAIAPAADDSAAARGYRFLTTKSYLPPDFNQALFEDLWRRWPEPLRGQAEKSSPEERRRLAFERYGLTPRPDAPEKPLQYVVDAQGNWSMNCFACHGGQVNGAVIPGLPNSNFALETLTEDIRATKLAQEKPLGRMDLGSVFMPLGTTRGTTNAVMFGVVLMGFRDPELNVHRDRPVPAMTHHDMDAPPWWHYSKKHHIYIDGFAQKGHRALMQFMLVQQNGPEKFREWETDFRDVEAYLESLQPPKYPWGTDAALVERGQQVFTKSCAACHGNYGPEGKYPGKMVAIEEVATDPVRLKGLTPEHRAAYGKSWFAEFGKHETLEKPAGYVAPPLNGIWASAPYLHNGSVPTLWHLLHPEERPVVWTRKSSQGYDQKRGGLEVETFAERPPVKSAAERREYFDTRLYGKSSAGHTFPSALPEEDRRALLEYLKTL